MINPFTPIILLAGLIFWTLAFCEVAKSLGLQ